jgi:hypothetical protein
MSGFKKEAFERCGQIASNASSSVLGPKWKFPKTVTSPQNGYQGHSEYFSSFFPVRLELCAVSRQNISNNLNLYGK